MTSSTPTYVAIDIAKGQLQIQIGPRSLALENNPTGFAKLKKELSKVDQPHVVFEATGGYERELMYDLFAAGITLSRINPCRIRAFGGSLGLKSKSDRIDARLILCYAQTIKPKADRPPEQARVELGRWMDRHHQLSEQLAREKNRLQMAPKYMQKGIQRMIDFIEEELSKVDQHMESLVRANSAMCEQDRILRSVQGIGPVNSRSILAYLGEIDHLSRNEVVALAGLAPFINESSTIKKKRRIAGGRAKLRTCLYMAAMSAAQHNPVICEYVERLKARGKPHKWVMVAAMRKLLLHIHSLLKKSRIPLAA